MCTVSVQCRVPPGGTGAAQSAACAVSADIVRTAEYLREVLLFHSVMRASRVPASMKDNFLPL